MSYGYYNNPKKTQEVFIQNPLQDAYDEKIYKTGDLAKYNEYGELVYISRKDFQIKHMGRRIELGEIETAASSLDGVNTNCCIYDEQKKRIVIFYVGSLNHCDFIERLGKMIPSYMLPSEVIQLKVMPLNLNGKIDRVLLKNRLEN